MAVQGGDPGRNWQFNGDYDYPVLSPSVRVYAPAVPPDEDFPEGMPERTECHSFVGQGGAQPGEIIFLDDSAAHQLRGVHPLVPWPHDYGFGDG